MTGSLEEPLEKKKNKRDSSCHMDAYSAPKHLLGSREFFKVTHTGHSGLHTIMLMDVKKLIFPQQQSQNA